MSIEVRLPPWRTVLAGLIAADVVLVALHLVGLAADSSLLRLSSEDNIPTWFSSAQFLLAGLTCWAAAHHVDRVGTAWIVLALVMTAFSADEIARLHERFETRHGAELAILIVEPILVLVVAGIVWSVRRQLQHEAAALLAAAMGSLVVSQGLATAVERFDPTGAVLELLAVSAELLELLTGALVMAAALADLERRQSSKNA